MRVFPCAKNPEQRREIDAGTGEAFLIFAFDRHSAALECGIEQFVRKGNRVFHWFPDQSTPYDEGRPHASTIIPPLRVKPD